MMNFPHVKKLKESWGNCGWAEVVPIKVPLIVPEPGKLEEWKKKVEETKKEFWMKVEKWAQENPSAFQSVVELGKRSRKLMEGGE